jgi:hypothetical protein
MNQKKLLYATGKEVCVGGVALLWKYIYLFFSFLLLNLQASNECNFILMIQYRQRKDKEGLVKMSSHVTEQLLSISRHLAETTQRSSDTLETLGMAHCCFICSDIFSF